MPRNILGYELLATEAQSMPVKKRAVKRRGSGSNVGLAVKNSKKQKLSLSRPEPPYTKTPGVVLTFGQGDVGQLGLGADTLERSRPAVVPCVDHVIDVCAGGMHTVCLTESGEVITFGCNDEGALGRDTSKEGSEMEPGKVILEGRVVQITAGDSHTAALLADGKVYAWGSFRDSSGTMGLSSKGTEKQPIEMLPGYVVVKIASGADHLVMLDENGQLYTCGCGEQGQLGRVTERGASRGSRQGMAHLLSPMLVTFKPRHRPEFEDVWAGTYCTFAKEKSKGDIYVFGLNNYNQLGLEEQKSHFHPVVSRAFSGKSWVQICGGQHHSIALDSEGVIYVLGRKEYGRLGLGEDCDDAKELIPISALRDKKCVDISCGSAVSFAVTDEGELYAWGMGSTGQLGTGKEEDVHTPQVIKSKQLESHHVLHVSGGGQHTVLLAKSVNQQN
ncbi:regulator of chromosome condensation isoform X2 [Cryptotermes secundus]|uniref:regulator of chromosome condensation isoform X2 n=1 Tax=Cryptotermes secundus TaxID=105785 RepID=UPI000CD7C152|nr:regulator of chromosome condensation isoform X2 [Cryptotermes secundus]